MMRNLYQRILFLSTIILICLFLYSTISIYSYSSKRQLIQVDAAIVLGAAVWNDKPSPVFRERINHGIWLYKKGNVDKLIFTGGLGKGSIHAESVVARDYATDRSIPDKDILIETSSQITEENIYYARQVSEEYGLDTFILVSDPLHMKRAMLMAKDYGLEAYTSPTPTTRYRSWKNKSKFMAREVFYYSGYLIYRQFKRSKDYI